MKFALIVFFLVVIGCVVFFVGWVQVLLPADTHAVAFTKTGGFDSYTTSAGRFSWRWERLIPTNMTLYTFILIPYHTDVAATGTLPSAEIYASVLPGDPDFSYHVQYSLSFKLKPDALPYLVSQQNLRPENLENWYQGQAAIVSQEATQALLESHTERTLYDLTRATEMLQDTLSEKFERLEFTQIVPQDIRLPDLELYRLSQETYRSIAKVQEEVRIASISTLEPLRQRENQTIEILREYGNLLSSYPVLMDFLDLVSVSDDGQVKANLNLKLPAIRNGSE